MDIFLRGLALGFSIAAPVGPIGVLCIRRSLAQGRLIGFATGLGAATADAAYGAVAGFGLTAISGFLVSQKFWLGLLGGLFLCYLGVRTLIARPAEDAAQVRSGGLLTAYLSTLLLTLTNPMTIIFFVAVFTGFGLGATPDYSSATMLVAGVFLGSAGWWLLLSGAAGFLRSRNTPAWMRTINWVSGLIILGFGMVALGRLFTNPP